VLASLTILTLQNALAGSVKVISNSSVTAEEISTDELRNIFLQTHGSLQEHMHVEPVLQKRGLAHEVFLKEVLHQSDDTLQNYYRTLVFTGKGQMPKAFGSDAEVLAYVARTRGAIGYISTTTESEGVKTLVIADAPEGTERKVIARVEPEYPETLLRLHIGGTVRLKVTISPKGGVEKVELLGGNPILAESAMIAVKQWIYTASHSRSTTEVSIPFAPR
jgi:TonB family protein